MIHKCVWWHHWIQQHGLGIATPKNPQKCKSSSTSKFQFSLLNAWHKCTKLSHPNKPFSAIIKPNGHQAHFQALQVLFQCFWPAGSDTWVNGFIMTVSFHQQWSLWKGCRSDHPSNLGSRLIYIWPFAMYFLTVQPMCCHPGGGGCCQVFCWSSNCLNWKRVVNLLGLPCHLKLLTLLLTFTFHCQQTQ